MDKENYIFKNNCFFKLLRFTAKASLTKQTKEIGKVFLILQHI